jgi:hypothetical protein
MKQDYSKPVVEVTLDPEIWEELRELGRRMVDDMFDYLQNIRSKPMDIERQRRAIIGMKYCENIAT